MVRSDAVDAPRRPSPRGNGRPAALRQDPPKKNPSPIGATGEGPRGAEETASRLYFTMSVMVCPQSLMPPFGVSVLWRK
jgi:hypothetical protein